MKQITFKEYKAIDISILSVLLLAFEVLSVYATTHWFSHSGVALVPLISMTPLVVIIAMMRWSGFAAIPALVGGFFYCFACSGKPEQFVIYCVGNLFGLIALLIIKKLGKATVRSKISYLVLTAVATYLFITVGRWLVSLIFVPSITTLLSFVTTDIMSLVVAIVGVVALQKSDGILEDQKEYLLRLERERIAAEESRAAMASAPYCEDDDEDYSDEDDDGIIWDDPPEAEESVAPEAGVEEPDVPDEPIAPDEPVEPEEISAPEHFPEADEASEDAEREPELMPVDDNQDNNNDEFNSEDKI